MKTRSSGLQNTVSFFSKMRNLTEEKTPASHYISTFLKKLLEQ